MPCIPFSPKLIVLF